MFGLLFGQIKKELLEWLRCTPEVKAKSAKTAMLFSRTNTLLVIANVMINGNAAQNLY